MARATTEPARPMRVITKVVRDSQPLRASPMTRRSVAIRSMNQISGTAAMPLNTAANTSAWMGLTPVKFRPRPISTDATMTP